MSEYITCLVCGKQFGQITGKHLLTHGITLQEYKDKFNNPAIITESSAKKRSTNLSKSKKGKPAYNKNKPMSLEQRIKLSNIAKNRIDHPRSGAVLSDETKSKISTSLKGKTITDEHRKNLKLSIKTRKEAGTYQPPIKKGTKLSEERKAESVKYLKVANQNKIDRAKEQFAQKLLISNITIIGYTNDMLSCKCNKCLSHFTFHKQIFRDSKRGTEVCPTCFPRETGTSNEEKEILEYIKTIYDKEIYENDRIALKGKELDIFLPDIKLAIEYCGLYWHSVKNSIQHNHHILHKQQYAFKEGIKVITIFSDEWIYKKEIVKSRIAHKINNTSMKIHARKCTIQKISTFEKNEFLEQNHIQGRDNASICYGAYYLDELVAVMTFTKPSYAKGALKTNDNYEYELNRYCVKNFTSVTGIAQRLFKTFILEYTPRSIISFSDNRWNTGNLYKNLGFSFIHFGTPNYWYLCDYKTRLHRSRFAKHKLKDNEYYDASLSEKQIMLDSGMDIIYDCGSSKWMWTASDTVV